MTLNHAQKKRFRAIGQRLKPIITIADKGVSEQILLELDRALEQHELIKIKVIAPNHSLKQATVVSLCDKSCADLVQLIGHTALLYRASKQPTQRLSNLLRHANA